MYPRARVPLLCVYVLLAACGLISLFTPVASVANTVIPIIVKTWGIFFLIGGIVSAVALISRSMHKQALGWWYIEIAGICLLATSALLYSAVLITLAVEQHSIGISGISCLILALSASLIGRAIDARNIAKLERKILDELAQRDREV